MQHDTSRGRRERAAVSALRARALPQPQGRELPGAGEQRQAAADNNSNNNNSNIR